MLNDQFFPIFSFERNKELSVLEVVIRLLLIAFVGYVSMRFYQEPETLGKFIYFLFFE
jgi:hypothetical protein